MSYKERDRSSVASEAAAVTAENVLLRSGVERIFDSLSHHRRRLILLLVKHGAVDRIEDVMVRSGRNTESVEIDLVHSHLPKLEQDGFIEWDRETGAISKGPRFDEIEPLLDLIENHADEIPSDWP